MKTLYKKRNTPEHIGNIPFFKFCLYPFYSFGGVVVGFAAFPLLAEVFVLLLFGAVVAVRVVAPATVAACPATCTAGCSSQWKGSKLAFGSTHDGFFEA